MPELEAEPSVAGFDVPAIIFTTARPCTEEFEAVLRAAVEAPRICGLAAPTVRGLTERGLA
jgi:hypothetical protein